MNLTKKCIAEAVGTFWLVLGGCGSAVLAATFIGAEIGPDIAFPLGLGFLGVSLAFGLTVLTMAYAIGHISGCHLNPAVSFGLWAGGRFPSSDLLPYIISQVVGAIVGTAVIYLVATGQSGFDMSGATWAANGFGELSPGNFGLFASFLTEVVMTFMFLVVILGATDGRAPQGFAPIAIGMALTLIHLISIPVTNTSVNPARSLGPALFAGPEYLAQVWLFWVAPILGAILAGWFYKNVLEEAAKPDIAGDVISSAPSATVRNP
ncbi:MAG: aquaporin AqpZ [Phormidesmis priestleyi Ana]|uniref:Aquaporin Z n=1 Tax=Phormidesmis priestleyi Ana TaxID=1666911 RepID=A0A0P7YZY4_9CYAN|nr:MAG: aquaporin AqpZ [Phormidesmis priestleyi Ana]